MKKIVAFLILSTVLCSCKVWQTPDVGEVKDFSIEKGSASTVTLCAKVEVKNPNFYKISIKKAKIKASLGDQEFEIKLSNKPSIKGNSTMDVPICLSADYNKLLPLVPGLLFGKSYELKVDGFLKGKAFIFSKKVPISFSKKINSSDLGNMF